MKNTIKLGLIALAVAGVMGAQTVSAAPMTLTDGDQIKLNWVGNYGGAHGGGAFTASGLGADSGGDTFLTFCLEFTEHISLNTAYFVDVNTQAVGGGSGVSGTYAGDVNGVSGSNDPLSAATAWLYTQFRDVSNNPLGVYGFTQNNAASHNAMQLAIWKLENEISSTFNTAAFSSYNSSTLAQSLVSAAIGATTGANPSWSGLGNVAVLNLYTSYTNGVFSGNSQSQLYNTPVPEPEIYAMMGLGLGLMGFMARRRKQAAV